MKLLGVVALALSGLLLGALLRRTYRGAESGTVQTSGSWMPSGVVGESWGEPIPDELAGTARRGDAVRLTYVQSRDFNIRYETYEFWRDSEYLGRWRVGAARYFAIVGALASGPLLLWSIALLMASLRRSRSMS